MPQPTWKHFYHFFHLDPEPYLTRKKNWQLNDEETSRGLKIFKMMDADGGGTVDINEICIVHDSDREQMLKILDADGNNEVTISCPLSSLERRAVGTQS